MKTITPYVLCAILAASLYSAAAAAADGSVRQRTVRFADLDLTQDSGIAMLYARIKAAARAVCEPSGEPGSGSVNAEWECRARAISGAIDTVDVPRLTSYHRSHQGSTARHAAG